jgi:hypothetical protein
MVEFLLSPFKAIFNLDTYVKATKQTAGKTVLFLAYLFVLTCLLFVAGVFIKMPPLTPTLEKITDNIAQVIPNIEVKNGVITANNNEYYEITPEGLNQKIVFDTGRTEPIYPTQMAQEDIAILVTSKDVNLLQQDNIQTYGLSENANFSINKDFFTENKNLIVETIKKYLILSVFLAMPVVVFLIMLILMILALLAMVIDLLFAKTTLSFGNVFSICCYLLAPVLFFLFIAIILPFNIPYVWLICFVLFMIYSQFILIKMKTQKQAEAEAENKEEPEEEK